ncbi:hypothetical protein BGZ94_000192 [Podila epigama]|nr:hypothetical protein BGZ94_000192 [Podila epigama]
MSASIPTSDSQESLLLDPSPTTALYQSYHSQLEKLKRLPVPYGEIYQTLSSHETTSLSSLGARYRTAAEALKVWLEMAEMTVFGLEMDVEQEGASDKDDVGEIDVVMHRFHPNIDMLLELKERIESRLVAGTMEDLMDAKLEDETMPQGYDDQRDEEPTAPVTMQELCETAEAIHSSWSSLNNILTRVKGNLASARLRSDLLSRIERVLKEMIEIDQGFDAFVAEKDRIAAESSSNSNNNGSNNNNGNNNNNNNSISSISSIDSASDSSHSSPITPIPPSPTLSSISMSSSIQNTVLVAQSGDSQAKHRNLEALARLDSRMALILPTIEELQVHIESLPASEIAVGGSDIKRNLRDCYQQTVARWKALKARREKLGEGLKEEKWLAVFEQVAGQVESMMESMERAILHCQGLIDKIKNMVRDKVVPSAPIDRDHLFTIFKSFEAKHKYYAPAVNKMLGMLENGIESRMTRSQDVLQKHQAMQKKWERLRGDLDRVEQELTGIEEYLDILDGSIPSHLPTPPMQLPEKPQFSMRRSQKQPLWNSSPHPLFQPPSQQQQQSQPVQQRGRKPQAASLQSPSPSSTASGRSKSPLNVPAQQRPWSPATSSSSFSSFSPMLSPNLYTGFRSLSRSPSRSPSRATSDKSRPWCPSTSVTSPSIPGIPHAPSVAATYIPRPSSATGHRRDRSTSPGPSPESVSRTGSAMSGSYNRSRSASGTPQLSRTPSQIKPAFSPVGSNSKLSTGIQPMPRSTSPGPMTGTSQRKSQQQDQQQEQLKIPQAPAAAHQYTRARTLSAPGPSSAMSLHRQHPPLSSSHGFFRETASFAAKVSSNQRSATSSPRPAAFSPPPGRTSGQTQQQQQRGGTRSVSQSGSEADQKPQRRRSSLSTSYFPEDSDPPPPVPMSTRITHGNNGNNGSTNSDSGNGGVGASTSNSNKPLQQQTRIHTKIASVAGSSYSDKIDSAYGSSPGSATGSSSSIIGSDFQMTRRPSQESKSSSTSGGATTHSGQGRVAQPSQRRKSFHQEMPLPSSLAQKSLVNLPEQTEDIQVQLEDVAPYVPVRGDVLDQEFARIVNASPVQMQIRRLAEGKYYFGGRLEDQPGGTLAVGGKMVLCRLMEYNRLSFSGTNGASGAQQQQQQQSGPPPVRPRARSNSNLVPTVVTGRTTRAASVGSLPVVTTSASASAAAAAAAAATTKATATTTTTGATRKARKVLVRVGGGWQDLNIFLLDHNFLASENAAIKNL